MSRLLRSRTLVLPVSAAVLVGSLVGFAAGDEPPPASPLVAAAELDRAPLPQGSDERGRAGVERSALQLAAALDAVPVRADGDERTRYCEPSRLQVQWAPPLDGEFAVGGHVSPVGPAPDDTTTEVNGIVTCEGASYAYMGFEARWNGAQWSVASVPALSDEHGLEAAPEGAHDDRHDEHDDHEAEPATAAAPPPAAAPQRHAHTHAAPQHAHRPRTPQHGAATSRGFSAPAVHGIDRYASYDPQRVCDPVAKPGTLALRNLLLATYPGTRSLGISRTCTARGVSEHKEGRAFDWGVDVDVPRERAAAETVLRQLLATDAAGHRHALARRLGVMYVIWNRQIWSAYSADRGWRPYSGANAHTDHVHLSLSWDGAMGRTSYWQGANAPLLEVDPELVLVGGGGSTGGGSTGGGSAGSTAAPRVEDEPRPARSRDRRDDDEHEDDRDELARPEDVAPARDKGKGKGRDRDDENDVLRVSYALSGAALPAATDEPVDASEPDEPPATAPGGEGEQAAVTAPARTTPVKAGTAAGKANAAPAKGKAARTGAAATKASKAEPATSGTTRTKATKSKATKSKATKSKATKGKATKGGTIKTRAGKPRTAKTTVKGVRTKAVKAERSRGERRSTKAGRAAAGRKDARGKD